MAQSFNTNLSNIAAQFAQRLNVPVTSAVVKQQLQLNPFYPSLYSLSNVFDKLNIPNQAFEVTENDLSLLRPPFINNCSRQITDKNFVLVTNKTVRCQDDCNNGYSYEKTDFLKE